MKRSFLISAVVTCLAGQISAGTTTVDPTTPGWGGLVETGSGSASFVSGPGTPPSGSGSLQFSLDDPTSGVIFGTQGFAGQGFGDLTTLGYSTYTTNASGSQAPAIQLNVDYDLTDSTTSWQGRLVFEGYYGSPVTPSVWESWDALTDRGWWSTGTPIVSDAPVATACTIGAPCTMATLLSNYPNAGVQTGVLSFFGFKAGSSWDAGYTGSVDRLVIGTSAGSETYDFEPATVVPVPPAIALLAGGLALLGAAGQRHRRRWS